MVQPSDNMSETAPRADGAPPQTRFGLILLLWLAGLGAAAQYGKVAVVFDMLPAAYPGAGAVLGWAVSLVGVVGIGLGVVAGVVVARVGLKRAMVWGLLGGAILSGIQGIVPPLWIFLPLRIVEGLFHLALVVAAPTLISQVAAPQHRGFALTLWGTFFGVAFALIAALGIPLAQAHGIGALFWAHSLWMLVFALLLAWRLPSDEPTDPAPVSLAALWSSSVRLYVSPRIGAAAWGWLFYTFSFVSLLTLIPPFIPETARTATLTAMPLVSIAASMVLGVALLRVMSAVQVVLIGFVAAALCVAGLLLWPGHPAVCLITAAALGLVQGASFAAVPELNVAPADRALANGGMAQMGNLGNTLGVPVLAAGIALAGLPGLVLPLVLALALGTATHLWLAARRRDQT
ncbi:MAG: MFS transporter [Pseudomonadota bacterium]